MSFKSFNILLVEDNPADVLLIRKILKEVVNTHFELKDTNRLDLSLKYLDDDGFDAMLLDLGLLDSQGINTFRAVKHHFPQLPIIILTGLVDEEFAIRAVREGAQDYLIKGQVDGSLLARSIRYAIERKQVEKQLKKSLNEKEMLIKETHHRVKNNLMMISGLLNLQSHYIHDEDDLVLFRESQTRANSMALIHERLYQSEDAKSIDFSDYIRTLAIDLFYFYVAHPDITNLNIEAEHISLNVDTAIPLGLIVHELISNSMKHAFPDGKAGEINVKFHSFDGMLLLEVSDNGMGLPDDLDYTNTSTLGLRLVNLLTDQIGGNIDVDSTQGTKFVISLKQEKN